MIDRDELWAEIRRLSAHGTSIRKEYGKAQKEIERLKEDARCAKLVMEGMEREIERLRAALAASCGDGTRFETLQVCERAAKAEAERDELLAALRSIIQWAEAYPLDIFHEPTKEEYHNATELLEANGMTLDAFSASMGRHCLKGVANIARAAIPEAEDYPRD